MSRVATVCELYACIDGDHRYSTKLAAFLMEDGSVEVKVADYSPAGGMDDGGRSLSIELMVFSGGTPGKATPAGVLRLVKQGIACSDTIRRYGKPTKSLAWSVGEERPVKGLSLALASRALVAAGVL